MRSFLRPYIALPRRARQALVVVLALVALLFSGSLLRIPVTVNGRRVAVPMHSTVRGVLAAAAASPRTGRLLSAADGRVVRGWGGTPAEVRLDGRPTPLGARVQAGSRLIVRQGRDAVERCVAREVRLTAPRVTVGEGGHVTLVAQGRDGLARQVVGAVSGDVVRTTVLRAPLPHVTRRERRSERMVALTFDDGPWPRQTDEVLAILRRYRVPATFFMLGGNVHRHPELAAHVAAAGCVIGNHTYTHRWLDKMPARKIRPEIERTNRAVERAAAVTPVWFRPPGGLVDDAVYAASRQTRMRPVLWTVDPQDWRGIKAAVIANRVSAAVRPGAVILLHDGGGDRTQTIKALPRIIKRLRAAGYDFVTLDELSRVKARW